MRAARERELSALLAKAHLAALDARVDPHFLFNALNTVVAVLPDDTLRSTQLLESLRMLLGAALDAGGPTWELREELRHTEHFLHLVRTRFGERIQVTCHIEDSDRETQVPRLAVQTLVENAIKHNAGRMRPLHVEVRALFGERGCSILVRDDGIGFAQSDAQGSQGGLTRLAAILRLLYGDRAALAWGPRAGGGAEVKLDLPREGGP